MRLVKTTSEGKTLQVDIGYQDSDGTPNLFIAFSASDAAGHDIRDPKHWGGELIKQYHKAMAAIGKGGFSHCENETVMNIGGIETSMGMKHDQYQGRHERQQIEGAGRAAL